MKGEIEMKIRELNKKELQEVVELYEETRNSFSWLITLEEFVRDYVRRCENCGQFIVLDDDNDELVEDVTWKGEHIRVCQDCYDNEHCLEVE